MRELALKILKEETGGFEEQSRLRDDVLDAMLRFVDETKQLTIPAVVGRSEQLLAFAKWMIKEENINSTHPEFYVQDFLESQ